MTLPRSPVLVLSREDLQITRILIRITFILMTIFFVMVCVGLIWENTLLLEYSTAAGLLLIVPWRLLENGRLRLGGFLVVMISLFSVTILATVGQGIHDLSIMGFPIIIVIASLFMRRFDFLLTSLLTFIAVGWLVFGESYGIYHSVPADPPALVDFIITGAILSVAVVTTSLLAENMRSSMRKAHRELTQRRATEEELLYQSTHDALTGIYNRAYFEKEIIRLEEAGSFPVSFVVADVDDLKKINDTQGHPVGDELLRRTANALRGLFRATDVLARIGGDEFAILLPNTDAATCAHLMERVHDGLEEQNARFTDLPVRISVGSATAHSGRLMEAFIISDQRMYADKARRKAGVVA